MEIYLQLAMVCTSNGQYNQALEHLTKANECNSKTAKYYHAFGYYYLKQDQNEEAVKYFDKIEFDDTTVLKETMAHIVEGYRKVQRFDEALVIANKAIEAFEDNYKGYSLRGTIYLDMNKHVEAIKDFEKAIELNKDCKEAKSGIIISTSKRGDFEQTMKLYNLYMRDKEKDSRYLHFKAQIFMNLNKYDEAMVALDKLIDRDYTNPKYLKDKAICQYQKNNYDECITIATNLLTIENQKVLNDLAILHFYLAYCYKNVNSNPFDPKYLEHLKLFEEKVPMHKRTSEYYLEEASKEFQKINNDKGIELVNRVLSNEPNCLKAIIMKIAYLEINDEKRKGEDLIFYNMYHNYPETHKQVELDNPHLQSMIDSVVNSSNLLSKISNSKPNNQSSIFSKFYTNQNSITFNQSNSSNMPNQIGEGGFAIVTTQLMPDNKVAAFKMFKENNQISLLIKEEEQKLFEQLNHPNIVKYHGFYKNTIIMEYCEGKDLFSLIFIKKEKVPTKLKYRIILQITEALNYLHHKNIVHGDIKSKNILLDKEYDPNNWPNAKLCDFGLSVSITESGVSKGSTPHYAAPEVYNESRTITSKSDIYSLGMTIYEIIAQKIPYEKESQMETQDMEGMLMNCVKRGIHPNFDILIDQTDCCQEIINLMNKMCQKLPNNRPTIKQVFLEMKAISSK